MYFRLRLVLGRMLDSVHVLMGLAILPGRLDKDLQSIEQAIKNNEPLKAHLSSYQSFKDTVNLSDNEPVQKSIEKAVGETFLNGLEHCGIFKQTETGLKAYKRFIEGYIHAYQS